jgi:hypothetical protein
MNNIYINDDNYSVPIKSNLKVSILCFNNSPDPKVKFLGVILDPTLDFKKHIKLFPQKFLMRFFICEQ